MRPGEPLYSQGSNDRGGEGRRLFTVIALSLGVVWLYTTFLAPKPVQQAPVDEPITEQAPTEAPTAAADASDRAEASDDDSAATGEDGVAGAPVVREKPEPMLSTRSIRGGTYDATFSNQGAGPSSWVLTEYYEELDLPWLPTWLWGGIKDGFSFDEFTLECPDGVPADLVRGEHGYHLIPSFDDGVPTFGGRRWEVIDQSDTHLAYRSQQGDLELVATYTLDPTSYLMGYQVTVRNTGSERRSLSPKMSVFQPMKPAKNRYSSASTPFASLDGKIKEYQVKSMDKKGLIQVTGKEIAFAGVGERYFMTALVPAERPASFEAGPVGWLGEDGLTLVNNSQLDAEGNEAPRVYRSTMLFNEKSLEPGDSATYDFDLYMGPKVLGELKELGVGLETTVKFGLFAIIARPMLWLLNFMYSLVHSWGIAIILLTVVVKLLVFPLDQASYKSMKKMRVLAPRMQEIRDQFKSDPQRQQQEIMNMYKEAGANPFSGCLPMLIQMPIWFALYRVLWSSIELYQVPFLYFCDLTARDPLCIFPLALSGVMYVQQKMSPPPTDPNQKMMMQMMPFFFAFIMFALPSGLVLYILVSSLLRLGQQWLVNRSGDDEPKAVAAAK